MQYVDNDMDDMFRKAAENYPLRTDGADWDALQARLSASDIGPAAKAAKGNNRRFLWLLLLLLVPVLLITTNRRQTAPAQSHVAVTNLSPRPTTAGHASEKSFSNRTDSHDIQQNSAEAVNEDEVSAESGSRHPLNPMQSRSTHNSLTARHEVPNHAGAQETPRNQRQTDDAGGSQVTHRATSRKNRPIIMSKADSPSLKSVASTSPGAQPIVASSNVAPRHEHHVIGNRKTISSSSDAPLLITQEDTAEKEKSTSNKPPAMRESSGVRPSKPEPNLASATDQPGDPSSQKKNSVDSNSTSKQPKAAQSVLNDKLPNEKQARARKADRMPKAGLYAGLMLGPDLSTIRSQKVSNVGYSAGGLLGYRFSSHWSLEASVYWDRKRYYTSGKYFDKTRANISPAVDVLFLDGSCGMIELPLAVRYDVLMKRSSVFFTAGLTSYLMKNESYDYGANAGGTYYENFRSYKNSGNHLFANLQLTAGYNYHVSKKLSLRIEPYFKMPLKHIGIGAMPISSKGLYLGIIRSIR